MKDDSDKTFRLLGTHRRILEILHRFEFCTREMLALAYERDRGRGRYRVRNDLVDLRKHDYIARRRLRKRYPEFFSEPREQGHGSEPWVYLLTSKGAQLKGLIEKATGEEDGVYKERRRKELQRISARQGIEHLEHALGVRTIHFVMELGSTIPRLTGHWSDRQLSTGSVEIADLRRLKHRFRAELRAKRGRNGRELEHLAAIVTARGGQVVMPRKSDSFRPDLTLRFDWPAQGGKPATSRAVICEFEQSHKNDGRKSDRFLAYVEWLRGKSLSDLTEQLEVGGKPIVLFVRTDTAERAASLARTARLTFQAAGVGKRNWPHTLFWPIETWFADQTERDSRSPTGEVIRRRLRDPHEIIRTAACLDLGGEVRGLFEVIHSPYPLTSFSVIRYIVQHDMSPTPTIGAITTARAGVDCDQ